MGELIIKVFVDEREYSQEELEENYVQRAFFTLHEMQKLGARILDQHSKELSESEINQIPVTQVREILLNNKLRIGKDGLNKLYHEQYRQADQMWHDIAVKSNGDYSQKVARAHLIVSGLSGHRWFKLIKSSLRLKKFLLNMHPDHIDASLSNVTEIMGMYGMPTEMKATLKAKAPEPVAEDHNLRLIGASYLTSNPNLVNAIAMHQAKTIKGGLDLLAGAYFPSATPQELVDGHSLHMAVEFSNAFLQAL